jgi:hypothetical protein
VTLTPPTPPDVPFDPYDTHPAWDEYYRAKDEYEAAVQRE